MFPREIECDLSLYHHIDVGDWHEGRLSSRKLLTLLDGLPGECWYKLSTSAFVEEVKEAEEYRYASDVGGLIFAQLSGQSMESPE